MGEPLQYIIFNNGMEILMGLDPVILTDGNIRYSLKWVRLYMDGQEVMSWTFPFVAMDTAEVDENNNVMDTVDGAPSGSDVPGGDEDAQKEDDH